MMKRLWPLCAALLATSGFAADLRQAKFTQVIKDVTVFASGSKAKTKANLNDLFVNPDIVQTGPDSLAELVAEDKTVTRIGANTVFAFTAKGREVNLEQGSVLFHSPKGKGGGTIKTKAASASVLGTTIVVTATVGGGFKAIVLEGKGQITLPNGDFRILQAGQVTFVLPGSRQFGPQLNINLQKLVESSRLVQGFETELPSKPVIQNAIERQTVLIKAGLADDTGLLVANQATVDSVTTVDSAVIEQAVDVPRSDLPLARATDVQMNTSDLSRFGSSSPQHLFLNQGTIDVPVLGPLNFNGILGKNITITAPALDFSPFLNLVSFTIAAEDYLRIEEPPMVVQSAAAADLTLTATPAHGQMPVLQNVTFVGRNGLTIEPGYRISASGIGDVTFISGAVMSLNNVSFVNADGKVELNGKQVLDLTGGGISSQALLVNGGTVSVLNGTYSAVNSAVFSAYGTELLTDGTTISGNIISLQANTSSDLHSTSATATTLLNLNSQEDVKVAGGVYCVTGGGGTLQLTAGRDIFAGSSAAFIANSVQMTATRSATLTGINASGTAALTINAGQDLTATGGSLSASSMSGAVQLAAGQSLALTGTTLSGNTIQASGNSADLNSVTASAATSLTTTTTQDLNVNGGSMTVSGGSGTAQLNVGRDLSVVGGAQFQADTIQMTAANHATLNNAQARGFNTLNVSAAGNLNIASGSFTGGSAAPGVAARFTAGDTLTANGATLSSVANISMTARTVNLLNINFPGGSLVNLYSQFGLLAASPNTGAASVPGYVNFIQNVNYNGTPAQAFVGSTINIGVRP